MGDLAIRKPLSALRLATEVILPESHDGDGVELTIHARNTDVALRDMAAYLELADHVQGRLHPAGYRSYVMRPSEYARIQEIQGGSVVIVIAGIVTGTSAVVALFLCLKYLTDSADNVASAYEHYQEGRLAKEQRKRIRREMEQDPYMSQLPRQRRNDLTTFIDNLLQADGELLVRAKRYADECVIDVRIRLKR